MEVREVTAEDFEAIRAIHVAAITELAASAYTEAQIDAWVEGVEVADYSDIADNDVYGIVAEDGGEILGFAALRLDHPDGYETDLDAEITAVYVNPSNARAGVGSRLVAALERKAQAAGVQPVGLESSVNAVSFYESNGYEIVRETTHPFGGAI